MITLENRFFPLRSAACFVIEGGIILFSVIASFYILQHSRELEVIDIHDAVVRGMVVAFFCQTCMYMLDLYDLKCSQSWGELFFSLLFSVGFVFIGIGLISYAIPEFGVGGRMYYLTILFVSIFLLLWRLAFDFYLSRIAPREKIVIVGTGEDARIVADEIVARERLGFHLTGFIGPADPGVAKVEGIGKILGNYDEMERLVLDHGVRKVVVAIGERRGRYPVREMLNMRVGGCRIAEWPEFFEKLSGRIPIANLAPSYFIFNEGFRKSRVVLFVRRVFSALFSAAALVIVLPVFIIVVAAIKADSPGPVFYAQERVGQNGKIFRIYKFRSMKKDAEQDGAPRWATRNDPRITRVGRIIRQLRIDELPQLFNVIRGDLDLVGPRPERPKFVGKLQMMIPYYSLRHTVKPGLTGWAQVMFTYCGTIEESKEKLQYDLFYIKNMSLKLDLLILFRTLKIVILGRGAR